MKLGDRLVLAIWYRSDEAIDWTSCCGGPTKPIPVCTGGMWNLVASTEAACHLRENAVPALSHIFVLHGNTGRRLLREIGGGVAGVL